jgi:quinol monooxygenase YgiN
MTSDLTTAAGRDADPGRADTRLTSLDPGAHYVTIINTYAVAPERAQALLDLLVRCTEATLRHIPGFVSASLHVSLDRTLVVNYAQWTSREAIAAARNNPSVAARISEAAEIADSFTPIPYELRCCIAAPRDLQGETWLFGEDFGQEVDEDPDLAGQEPAPGPDRADRQRRRLEGGQHRPHGA